MKNISMIVWLTQLGLSVAIPPAGFVLLAVWLRRTFDWGNWVIIVAVVLGVICALDGLRVSLKTMNRIAKEDQEPPVSFNEHD